MDGATAIGSPQAITSIPGHQPPAVLADHRGERLDHFRHGSHADRRTRSTGRTAAPIHGDRGGLPQHDRRRHPPPCCLAVPGTALCGQLGNHQRVGAVVCLDHLDPRPDGLRRRSSASGSTTCAVTSTWTALHVYAGVSFRCRHRLCGQADLNQPACADDQPVGRAGGAGHVRRALRFDDRHLHGQRACATGGSVYVYVQRSCTRAAHSITAVYGGDTNYIGSTSNADRNDPEQGRLRRLRSSLKPRPAQALTVLRLPSPRPSTPPAEHHVWTSPSGTVNLLDNGVRP